jgi:hypothetical protein
MAKEKKPTGPVIHAPTTLNGRKVTLNREGVEVRGVIMSNSGQFSNDELVFKWTSKNGTAAVGPLTGEELEKLLNG